MSVKLIRVTESDLERLMVWRMRPDITEHMLTNPTLTIEGQRKWFQKLCEDESQIRWIIFYDDVPIGSIYLVDIDYDNKRCESGWFVAEKKYRSLRLAVNLQFSLWEYIFETLKFNKNYGYVMDTNKDLIKMLNYFGYETEGILKQHAYKAGIYHDIFITGMTKNRWDERKGSIKYEKYSIE